MNHLTQTLCITALSAISVISSSPLSALACSGSDFGGLEGQVGLSGDTPEALLATPEGVALKVSYYEYGFGGQERSASYDDAMTHELTVRVMTGTFPPDPDQLPTEVEGTLEPAEGVERGYLLWRPASPLVEGEDYYLLVGEEQRVALSVVADPEGSAPSVDQLRLFEEEGDPVRDCCSYNCETYNNTCEDVTRCDKTCWATGYAYSTRYELGWSNPNQAGHGRSLYQLSIDGVVKKSAPPWTTTALWEGDLGDLQEGVTCFQLSSLNLFTGEVLDAEERCMELSEVNRVERLEVSASDFSASELDEWSSCTELTPFQQSVYAERGWSSAGVASEGEGEGGCTQGAGPQGVTLLLLALMGLLRVRRSV